MKRMVIVLTVVMVLSGLILAFADSIFSPQIEKNRAQQLSSSLASLFEGAKNPTFEKFPLDNETVYRGTDNGTLLGYAVAVDTPGYGGTISLLIGVAPDLKTITGMEVVSNIETPGLGARIIEPWFRKQFVGLDPNKAISYIKNAKPVPDKNEIEAISGATITTKAVVSGLNSILDPAVAAIRKSQQ
jgi:H+/Na+-translocating ferredoxin:NAD+ oxidoreductase subunit G